MAGKDDYYTYKAPCPERRLIARVARAEQVGTGPRARHSYEFDAVDFEVPLGKHWKAFESSHAESFFALVRVVTTSNRFMERFDATPQVGQWYSLEISPKKAGVGGPIAFHAQLTGGGYTQLSRGTLANAEYLFDDDTIEGGGGGAEPPRRRSLGAAAVLDLDLARDLALKCDFPPGSLASDVDLRKVLGLLPQPLAASVYDVGQASFVCLTADDHSPLLYFDAGWPVVFNGKTAPRKPTFQSPNPSAPVLLSHWDWDHLSGFHKFPQLQRAQWVTPVQRLGPGAKKIAAALAKSNLLHGWTGNTFSWGWGRLYKCGGLPTVANQSGLAVVVTLKSGRKALLVGDAHYDTLPLPPGSKFEFLVVTHHGALFQGNVPAPVPPQGISVISVGRGNVYKHPKSAAVRAHKHAGWSLQQTSAKPGSPRGDKVLGP